MVGLSILLFSSPAAGLYSGIILGIVNIFGVLGHLLFRDYLHSRPDVQKTIMNSILLMLSYGLQNVSIKMTFLTVSSRSFSIEDLKNNGLVVCNLIGMSEYVAEYLFLFAFSSFTIVRNWRRFLPSTYFMFDHNTIIKIMLFIFFLTGAVHLAVQLITSGNVCNAQSANYIVNMTYETELISTNTPWFNILTTAITCVSAVLGIFCMTSTCLFALYNFYKMKMHAKVHAAVKSEQRAVWVSTIFCDMDADSFAMIDIQKFQPSLREDYAIALPNMVVEETEPPHLQTAPRNKTTIIPASRVCCHNPFEITPAVVVEMSTGMVAFFLLSNLVYVYWPNKVLSPVVLQHLVKLPLFFIVFVPWILIIYLEDVIDRLSRLKPDCFKQN